MCCAVAIAQRHDLLAGEDEDEQHGERQVDEVRRLDQTDGQEEQRLQLPCASG